MSTDLGSGSLRQVMYGAANIRYLQLLQLESRIEDDSTVPPNQGTNLARFRACLGFLQDPQLLLHGKPTTLCHENDFRICHGCPLSAISRHQTLSSALPIVHDLPYILQRSCLIPE